MEKIDSTEHNLFECVCIESDEIAAKMRAEILLLIATLKGLNPETFKHIVKSDIYQASIIFLNPSSSGIDPRIRIDINSPYIRLIFVKIQNYVLYVHNCRTRYGIHSEEKQLGRPRKLAKKKRSSHDNSKGLDSLSSGAKTKMKLITQFFHPTQNGKAKPMNSQIASTQRELMAMVNNGAWNCIGTVTGASIFTIHGVWTNDFSSTELFRTAIVRQHVHKSLIKCLLLKWDDRRILKSVRVVTIDCLNQKNAADLAQSGLFNICNIDEDKLKHEDPLPVSIICTDNSNQLVWA